MSGSPATVTVDVTVLVAALMTETELESGLATYTVFPSGEATTCQGMSPTLIVR